MQGGSPSTPALLPYTSTRASAFEEQSPEPISQTLNNGTSPGPHSTPLSLPRHMQNDEVRLRRELSVSKNQQDDHPDILNVLQQVGELLIQHDDEHYETADLLGRFGEVMQLEGRFRIAEKFHEKRTQFS